MQRMLQIGPAKPKMFCRQLTASKISQLDISNLFLGMRLTAFLSLFTATLFRFRAKTFVICEADVPCTTSGSLWSQDQLNAA